MQVVLAEGEIGRSVDFYERAFGWPRNERIDDGNYVEFLPPDGGSVGLFESDGYTQLVGASAAWFADPDGNVIAVARSTTADDRVAS